MSLNIIQEEKDLEKYFYVTYEVGSDISVYDAAFNIAVGQSIGNPSKRSVWETDEMIEDYCAKIVRNDNFTDNIGTVEVAFPYALIDFKEDGIAQLLCIIAGGQSDIAAIKRCRAQKIEMKQSVIDTYFHKPKYGITGMREFTGQYNKPLFGGIIKPKSGITPQVLLEMVKELVDGGVDFIKEDEILSSPAICRIEDRVELISNYLQGKKVVYSFCINSDPAYLLDRAKFVAQNGGNGIHVNVWSGLGAYKNIRELDLPLNIHYQRSGMDFFASVHNPFSVSWHVLCQLAAWCGVDTIHAGMFGGYLSDTEEFLGETLRILREGNVVPALSCGLTADHVAPIVEKFGVDWMANAGGSIHGHPNGSTAGAKKIRDSVEACKK
jgi:ribulose-bisphosphate carboxylase large chain